MTHLFWLSDGAWALIDVHLPRGKPGKLVLRALGKQHRLQRARIVGKRIGHRRHDPKQSIFAHWARRDKRH